jgi:hypothetical protein
MGHRPSIAISLRDLVQRKLDEATRSLINMGLVIKEFKNTQKEITKRAKSDRGKTLMLTQIQIMLTEAENMLEFVKSETKFYEEALKLIEFEPQVNYGYEPTSIYSEKPFRIG